MEQPRPKTCNIIAEEPPKTYKDGDPYAALFAEALDGTQNDTATGEES
jgi:hypothetical protein